MVLGVDMDHVQNLAVVEFKDELEDVIFVVMHMVEGGALDRQYKHDAATLIVVQVGIPVNNSVLYH